MTEKKIRINNKKRAKMNNEIYGKHLTLLIKNVEHIEKLNGENEIKNFLADLVKSINMRILVNPVAGYESGDEAHAGYSGVVILYESHCAIHTYSKLRKVFIDIFSCKDYCVEDVLNFIKGKIGVFEIEEQHIFNRGVHWGNDIKKEMNNWKGKR